MFFIDGEGYFQLTGAGLVVSIVVITLVIVGMTDFVKKFFWYRRGYKRLRSELDWLEQEFEKNLPTTLEKYYQQRKRWEKNNLYW